MTEGAARQKLVDEHAGLVRALAAKVHRSVGQHVEFDELVSLGTTGLLEAADRFDDGAGVAFSTFAYYRVHGAIYDGLRQMAHIPRSEYVKHRAAERASEYLETRSVADTASRRAGSRGATNSEDELRAMYDALRGVATVFVTSLEGEQERGAEHADTAHGPEERLALAQLRTRIAGAIAALPERERHFIEKHYFQEKTLVQAGAELGLSRSWSSRLHARAVDLLRDALVKQHAI